MTKTLLSLFDYSGQWSAPFADAGWMVVQVDIKHGHDIKKFSAKWLIDNVLQAYPTIDGILGAPPCTVFTKSAAQYWPAMDADGRTAESVNLVYQFLRCVDYLKPDFALAFCAANAGGQLGRKIKAIEAAANEIVETPPAGLASSYVSGFLTRNLPDIRLRAWERTG